MLKRQMRKPARIPARICEYSVWLFACLVRSRETCSCSLRSTVAETKSRRNSRSYHLSRLVVKPHACLHDPPVLLLAFLAKNARISAPTRVKVPSAAGEAAISIAKQWMIPTKYYLVVLTYQPTNLLACTLGPDETNNRHGRLGQVGVGHNRPTISITLPLETQLLALLNLGVAALAFTRNMCIKSSLRLGRPFTKCLYCICV
ncbi:hypothetical protein V8C37DRAFT_181303 [Trichoderma ceciliae]